MFLDRVKIYWKKARPAKSGLAGVGIGASMEKMQEFAQEIGFSTSGKTGEAMIVSVLDYLTGIFIVIFTCVILWSGFKWMTAGGSKEKIESAKKFLINAVIGIIIVISAWTIVRLIGGFNNFIENKLEKKTKTTSIYFDNNKTLEITTNRLI